MPPAIALGSRTSCRSTSTGRVGAAMGQDAPGGAEILGHPWLGRNTATSSLFKHYRRATHHRRRSLCRRPQFGTLLSPAHASARSGYCDRPELATRSRQCRPIPGVILNISPEIISCTQLVFRGEDRRHLVHQAGASEGRVSFIGRRTIHRRRKRRRT